MSSLFSGSQPIVDPMNMPTAGSSQYIIGSSPNSTLSTDFTQSQQTILEMSSRVASMVSIIASLSIIMTFLFWKKFRTPANRLLIFMASADLISAASSLLGKWAISLPDFSPLCIAQAFMMQFGDLSSVFWTAAMSCNLFLVLFFTRSARDLVSLEKWYFFICFGIPFALAFAPIFIWNAERKLAYGKDVLWCWFTPQWDILRLTMFYIPVWTIFLFNLTIYIISSLQIIARTADLPPLEENRGPGNGNTASSLTLDSAVSEKPIRRPAALSTASTMSTQSIMSLTTLKTFRTRYFVRIALFLLAYLLVWIVPSINRIRGWLGGDQSIGGNFILYWMQEILVPLRGCINFLCYFIMACVNSVDDARRAEMAKFYNH